jgi:hypothetical protein
MDTALLHELIDAAARDVETYENTEKPENPNRRAAGDAAIQSLDAVARAVQGARASIANTLYSFDRPGGHTVPGNSGPGF